MARDERTYIKVHDGIEDHPKIVPLSDKAFRVLVTTWGWSSKHHTDGRVPLAVWKKRGTAKSRRELVDGRLAEVYDDHVQMHDYLQHQRSAAEIEELREEKRSSGVLGNHKRWHVDGKPSTDCPHCIAKASQPRTETGSQTRSQTARKTSPDTDTDTKITTHLGNGGGSLNVPRTNPTPQRPRDRCRKHADVDDPPACGSCADARRNTQRWDTEQRQRRDQLAAAIEQAQRDRRQECEHGTPGGLFMHPDTDESLCALCRHAPQEAAS